MSTASPRPHFVIDVIEHPFALRIANEQFDIVWFTSACLEQDIFATIGHPTMIQNPLMTHTELIRREGDKCTRRDKPNRSDDDAPLFVPFDSRQKNPEWHHKQQATSNGTHASSQNNLQPHRMHGISPSRCHPNSGRTVRTVNDTQ